MIGLLSFLSACTVSPEPIDEMAQAERTKADLERLREIEFVPTQPITLHEAMARAVAFNLKRRVSQIERNIAEAELEQSNYEMLPTLELNAGKNRNDVQISASDDRITKSADASFTWNLLDLGVSYARAKQRADEVLIAREKERKALQDIIRQVNTAFWRAATGERLMKKVSVLAKDLKLAMAASRRMEETRATDIISAVAFRREVVESVRQALTVQRELGEAKGELAELLNIRPGTPFSLALPVEKSGSFRLPMAAQAMEQHALLHRPELRIEDYNERIGDWQAREAIYDMLPGLDLSIGQNYSSESSNLSPNWISTGLNLGMNIFNLFSGTSEVEAAEHKSELARQQRLAMSLAVLTQLHIARVKFRNAEQQMRLVTEIADSDRHLARLVATDGRFLNKDYFEAIRLATRQMNSEMDEQRTLVELVSTHAEVMHAIGQDTLPDRIPLDDIPTLASAIRDMTAKWYAGERPGDDSSPAADHLRDSPMDKLVEAMLPRSRQAVAMAAVAEPVPTTSGGVPAPELIDEDSDPVTAENGSNAVAETPAPAVPEKMADVEEVATTETNGSSLETIDEAYDLTADAVEMLNEIAPASRGGASVAPPKADDWELLPGGPWQPEMAALATNARQEAQSSERYVVSLGAFRQQENAFRLHAEIASRSPQLFEDTPVRIVLRPAANGSTYYFVQTDPMPDRHAAAVLCRSLKRSGRACNLSPLSD